MKQSPKFGLETARTLVGATDQEWPRYIERLRKEKLLSNAVTEMNAMLRDPGSRALAIAAFQRIGLWHEENGPSS